MDHVRRRLSVRRIALVLRSTVAARAVRAYGQRRDTTTTRASRHEAGVMGGRSAKRTGPPKRAMPEVVPISDYRSTK